MRIDGGLVRLAFIAYLAVTLADCLLRQGFLAHDGRLCGPAAFACCHWDRWWASGWARR